MSESIPDLDAVIQGIKESFDFKIVDISSIDASNALFAIQVDDEGHVDVLMGADDFDLPNGISEIDLIDDQLDNLIPGVRYGVFSLDDQPNQQRALPERIGSFSNCFALYRENDAIPDPLVTFSVTNGTLADVQYSDQFASDENHHLRDFIKVEGVKPAAKHIYQYVPGNGRFSLYGLADIAVAEGFKKYMFNKKNAETNATAEAVNANTDLLERCIIPSSEEIEGAIVLATIDPDSRKFTFELKFYDLIDIKDKLDVPMDALAARIMHIWKESEAMSFETPLQIAFLPNISGNEINQQQRSAVESIDNMISLISKQQ